MNFWQFIGWLAPVLLAIDMIPQVYKTFTTKNVEGQSLFTLILWGSGCLCAGLFSIHEKVPWQIIITYGVDTATATALVIGYWMYRKKRNHV